MLKGEHDKLRVTGRVLQGSGLGPILFIINVNDLETGLTRKKILFAIDIKLGNKAQKKEDHLMVQRNLD